MLLSLLVKDGLSSNLTLYSFPDKSYSSFKVVFVILKSAPNIKTEFPERVPP